MFEFIAAVIVVVFLAVSLITVMAVVIEAAGEYL